MRKILDYEIDLLKTYLKLPNRKLLEHKFEIEEDFLAGYVQRFLKGERFSIEFIAFTESELNFITPILNNYIQTDDGKDLLTAFLLAKTVCNIMNKYKL